MEGNDIENLIKKTLSNLKNIEFYNSQKFKKDKERYINNLINNICELYNLFSIEQIQCTSPAMNISNDNISNFSQNSFGNSSQNKSICTQSNDLSEDIYMGDFVEIEDISLNVESNFQNDEYESDNEIENSIDSKMTDASTDEITQKIEESAISKVYSEIKNIYCPKINLLNKTQIKIFKEFINYLRND